MRHHRDNKGAPVSNDLQASQTMLRLGGGEKRQRTIWVEVHSGKPFTWAALYDFQMFQLSLNDATLGLRQRLERQSRTNRSYRASESFPP